MRMIIFDLETTDLHSVGQILNYAFCEYEDGVILSTLCGDIDLMPHQLPAVSAIQVTGIDISKHLSNQYGDEKYHMARIYEYIQNIVEHCDHPVVMVGHNIAKFDLNFLRTSLIRNGYNPYFGRNLTYGDTIHWTKRYLFRNEEVGTSDVSLALQKLIERFDLPRDRQAHSSLGDVQSTIDLIEFLESKGENLRKNTYELISKPVGHCFLEYKIKEGQIKIQRSMLISENRNYSLILNLDNYREDGEFAVSWKKKDLSTCIVAPGDVKVSSEEFDAALDYIEEQMNQGSTCYDIETYFQTPICDIENHIYRMPFGEIDLLHNAIHRDRTDRIMSASTDCAQLYLRSLMPKRPKILKKYIEDRYVSQSMIMVKHQNGKQSLDDISHWTLKDQYQLALQEYSNKKTPELKSLIDCYEKFAKKFDIEI